ncbi:MAG: hypothetical protein ACI8UO_005176, partial [Verrucomicrobiales bacterium]
LRADRQALFFVLLLHQHVVEFVGLQHEVRGGRGAS